MSLSRIPEKYLNTTLHIVRDATSIDEIGDVDTVRELAYGSIRANVQPKFSEIAYELHGKVHQQSHVAYFNRFEGGTKRTILAGDYAIDLETGKHFLVLGVLEFQAANNSVTDSHHFKLILKTVDGKFDVEQSKAVTSKARII